MWSWLRSKHRAIEAPLRGAQPSPRQKTYSAATGYVYQYVYRGQRTTGKAQEFVFSVTRDRKSYFAIRVILSEEALEEWRASAGRELLDAERYAIAKMTLFDVFDEVSDPQQLLEPMEPTPSKIQQQLERLGRA